MKTKSILIMLDGTETPENIGTYMVLCKRHVHPEKIGLEARVTNHATVVSYFDAAGLTMGSAITVAENFLAKVIGRNK